MSTRQVIQGIGGWDGWPEDVRERLREWNRLFLLSFVRNGDFLCPTCGWDVKGHPNGNCVVRPHPKAHGVTVCEGCLIALARDNEFPPAPPKPPTREERLLRYIEKLQLKNERLRQQIVGDQAYIDLLEEHVTHTDLASIRNELRGTYRRKRDA